MMVVHGKFEWDSNKNEINIKKHGLSFDAILEVFNDPYFIEKIDIEHSTLEEERLIGIGSLNGFVIITNVIEQGLFLHVWQQKRRRLFIMSKEKTLTAERVAELRKNIDLSDIPEITDFSGFKPRYPEYFKPKREQVSIRLSKYLIDHFRAMGKGWQTKVNDFLMDAVNNGQI